MEINIRDIFKSTFGYELPEVEANIPTATKRLTESSLGSPYYGFDILGREFFLPVTINDYLISFAVVSMTWEKTIVSTPMPERGGSVNEQISIDDYKINIKGILINDSNVFPESQIIDLHELFLKNESVKIECALTDIILKGDFEQRAIIKRINWPAVTGIEHARPFDMELVSDMAFDLIQN